jgi:hypothetical protein
MPLPSKESGEGQIPNDIDWSRAYADARTRVDTLLADLPSDPQILQRVKAILLSIAMMATDDKNRVAAARALIEACLPRVSAIANAADMPDRLPPNELMSRLNEVRKSMGEAA